jgi:hypothetical protein
VAAAGTCHFLTPLYSLLLTWSVGWVLHTVWVRQSFRRQQSVVYVYMSALNTTTNDFVQQVIISVVRRSSKLVTARSWRKYLLPLISAGSIKSEDQICSGATGYRHHLYNGTGGVARPSKKAELDRLQDYRPLLLLSRACTMVISKQCYVR